MSNKLRLIVTQTKLEGLIVVNYRRVIAVLILAKVMFAQGVCAPFSPTIDGCSDPGGWFSVNMANVMTDFTPSCNSHDYCYRTIGLSKDACEAQFYKQLDQSCDEKYLNSAPRLIDKCAKTAVRVALIGSICPFCAAAYELVEQDRCWTEVVQIPVNSNPMAYESCKALAPVYYEAVNTLGGAAYRKDQQQAVDYARSLARSWAAGECVLSPSQANLFAGTFYDQIEGPYRAIFNRGATNEEVIEATSIYDGGRDTYWQWKLINRMDGVIAGFSVSAVLYEY